MFENLSKKERDGDGDGGNIFPEHPSPILHAPRDNISRKGKSLTLTLKGDLGAAM